MVGTRKWTNVAWTPLDQGKLHRLNQAANRVEKKAGQRRKTRSTYFTPTPELQAAKAAAAKR
eukprot:scaffold54300_cov49-Attheya_sp.AAC.5